MDNNFSTPGFLWPLLIFICTVVILVGLNKTWIKAGWDKWKRLRSLFGTVILVLLWTGLLAVLSNNGFFADFDKLPPRPPLALLFPLPFVLVFAFSKKGTQLLQLVPPQWLICMQSFRILVELLIWFAFLADKLPIQMTLEGRNFDVITGLLALPAGYLVMKNKRYAPKLILAFNITGIVLLLNIIVISMLSFPTSFRYFLNEPSSAEVAQFPFILLPGVLVPIAYSFHIFSIRQVLIKK